MGSVDEVDLNTIFARRANVMRSISHFLKGPYRAAVRLAMREDSCGWKLFLLLPRMFLSRPPRGGLVLKTRLMERLSLFHNGQWSDLVERSAVDAAQLGWNTAQVAHSGVCVLDGELSAGRQALEGAEVAPGTQETVNALRERRPRTSRPLSRAGCEPRA